MARAPQNKGFNPASMSEMLRPCQHCVQHCTKDPNHFCAVVVSSSSRQCSRCQQLHPTKQKGGCAPVPGVNKKTRAFLAVRNTARHYPNHAGIQRAFIIFGRLLRNAISGRTNTETLEVDNEGEEGLTIRVVVLEIQLRTLVNRVSQLETRLSSPRRDNVPQQTSCFSPYPNRTPSAAIGNGISLTRLRSEEAELDAAIETARLQASISRKRARVDAVGQGLPDPDSHTPISSSDRPAKRQETRCSASQGELSHSEEGKRRLFSLLLGR
ncbi:hypothetical protein F4818DRAFT_190738 [Hypoxylon cercidicola]|nr:hypothetical protein F4818DRAFT_190738 [Hypoxylon cercidicola]